jgi:hypothetical protein
VGRVVARAMEKRPEDRYETVGELIEDFTIAAGMEPVSVSSSGTSKRIEPPTAQQLSEDADEETLVRRRVTRPMEPPIPPPAAPSFGHGMSGQMPPPNTSFNPWKVLIPSAIGLLVIFGVIYAFTRSSQPTNATTPGTLAADPNSSPVEPAKPATGQSEAGLPAGGTTSQSANTNASASPEVSENPNDVNLNANDNANENSNTKKPSNLPLPSPTRSVDLELPPPSAPATKPAQPKPTPSPADGAAPELQ